MKANNLTLNNVKLKPISEADLPLILSWRNSPEVNNYFIYRAHITFEEHEKWYNKINNDRNQYYLILQNNQPKGLINLKNIDRNKFEGEWGIYLAKDNYRSQKIGTMAAIILMDHAYDTLYLEKVKAQILSNNIVSLAFHRSLGFNLTSTTSDSVSHMYSCYKIDYFERRKLLINKLADLNLI